MIPKQKKLNPLSDMKALNHALSADEWQKLQNSRLYNFEPSLLKNFRSKAAKSRKREALPPLPKVASVKSDFGTIGKSSAQINFIKTPQKNNFFTTDFSWRAYSRRVFPAMAGFLALGLLVLSVFPLLSMVEKNRQTASAVLGAATSAYGDLKLAGDALMNSDLTAADSSLIDAYRGFDQAREQFEKLSALTSIFPETQEAKNLLSAAQEASLALQYLNSGMQGFLNLRLSSTGLRASNQAEALQTLELSFNNLRTSGRYFDSVEKTLAMVDTSHLPAELAQQLQLVKDRMKILGPAVTELMSLQEFLAGIFLGQEKQFLILFENYRELRATGGFIGTYGLLGLNQGQITKLKIESIYNPDGQLKEKIAAPGALQQRLSETWAMRDSNWFFDFPKSAKKTAEFLELETGEKVDGVMAFTPEIFVRLMNLVGPIPMPEYKTQLTAENFVDEVQRQTSEIYDRKLNQPKKFLADFAPRLLEKISALDATGWLGFLEVMLDSLDQKDILLYSGDEGLQSRLSEFNWTGEVRSTLQDYLAVVNSNVGGGKTDQNIFQDISLEVTIYPNGETKNRLTIVRRHEPGREKEFPVNYDFMRIFVPVNSKLLSASGFDLTPFKKSELVGAATDPDLQAIDDATSVHAPSGTLMYEESGRGVFANWVVLPPGESRTVTIEYQTPFSYSGSGSGYQSYSLLAQKQSGASPSSIDFNLILPEQFKKVWEHPGITTDKIEWSKDLVFGAIFE